MWCVPIWMDGDESLCLQEVENLFQFHCILFTSSMLRLTAEE